MPPERDPKVERAVKLFINGVNVMKAIERSGASCSKANIYDIVKRRGLQRHSPAKSVTMIPSAGPEKSLPNEDLSSVLKFKWRLTKVIGDKKEVKARKPYRLNSNQVNQIRVKKIKDDESFKQVFKASTIKLAKEERRTAKRTQEIISEIAEEANISPGSAPKVERVMLYVRKGKIGVSPEKGKPKEKYPRALFDAASSKISLSQVSNVDINDCF